MIPKISMSSKSRGVLLVWAAIEIGFGDVDVRRCYGESSELVHPLKDWRALTNKAKPLIVESIVAIESH